VAQWVLIWDNNAAMHHVYTKYLPNYCGRVKWVRIKLYPMLYIPKSLWLPFTFIVCDGSYNFVGEEGDYMPIHDHLPNYINCRLSFRRDTLLAKPCQTGLCFQSSVYASVLFRVSVESDWLHAQLNWLLQCTSSANSLKLTTLATGHKRKACNWTFLNHLRW